VFKWIEEEIVRLPALYWLVVIIFPLLEVLAGDITAKSNLSFGYVALIDLSRGHE